MNTARETAVQRAVLSALRAVPEEFLLPERTLRADAARGVTPAATQAELTAALTYLDGKRRVAGLTGESDLEWQITPAGRLWLAQNP